MPKKKNVSTNQQKDLAQHKIFLVKQVKGRVYSNEQEDSMTYGRIYTNAILVMIEYI